MLELSLFSGVGGGLLGSHLLGWRPVGYVEIDDYCQRVLAARIRDGYLPDAPIFGDIRAFIRDGYAERYRGVADVVTAGFPCQPFSVAGKQQGADDDRNLWPETRDTLRIVRPQYCLLENVPGLLAGSHGYFGTILGELAELGYDARWGVLGADDAGAPHRRKRLWVLAYADSNSAQGWHIGKDASNGRRRKGPGEPRANSIDSAHVAGAEGITEREQADQVEPIAGRGASRSELSGGGEYVPDPVRVGRDGRPSVQQAAEPPRWDAAQRAGAWWSAEPAVGRVAHGVAHRVDRLRALGNGQVPAVVRLAWMLLSR